MNAENSKVDWFFEKDSKWKNEYSQLRRIVLDCGLTEELKWGHPCYTFQNNNIVLIHGFKKYCALLFHKGVLLKDTNNILIQQTENVQSARQIRFTGVEEIISLEKILKTYIYEAIEVEKAGIEVKLKKTKEFAVPEEFQEKLDENPDLKNAFEALTPGRQRGYLLYFSEAKRSQTRTSRIEKAIPKIFQGKGRND
ncbi:MAG TPA: YdeI family protein [Flavobacteriaceae bacterium]|nr:YdeI family protein [Flavobacteriaceae bacterium]